LNEQAIAIEELWAVIGKAVWEKYQVEKQLAEAAVKIQELSALLWEKERGADSAG